MQTGAKIKKIRKQKGLTQKQLGDLCGIADANIRKYENGKQNPKIETLQKIADALREPLSIFLDNKLFDATTNDKEYKNNQASEFLQKRIESIAKDDTLSNDKKIKMLDDLMTSGNIIIQEYIDHLTVAKKQLLDFYFDELNMNGQDKAIEQVEMLTKISEYRNDTISNIKILEDFSDQAPPET